MILDSNRYKVCEPIILDLHKKDRSPEEIAIAIEMPIASVIMFIQKNFGTTDELDQKLSSVLDFYKYSDIIPIEE